jgi:hypothetical protein
MSYEVEIVTKSHPTKKSPEMDVFTAEFHHIFQTELFSTKYKGKEHYQTHSMKPLLL